MSDKSWILPDEMMGELPDCDKIGYGGPCKSNTCFAALEMKVLSDLLEDARQLTAMATGKRDAASILRVALSYDSFTITSLNRARQWARRSRVPLVNHALRVVQTAVHGIEIGKDVTLGHGVWFIHPLAIVIGGNTKVGNRVRFFGNNTLGQAKEDGYPILEDDVWVGAGARVLGSIRVGARSMIGANAVVLTDVPADSIAVGIPARILPKKKSYESVGP